MFVELYYWIHEKFQNVICTKFQKANSKYVQITLIHLKLFKFQRETERDNNFKLKDLQIFLIYLLTSGKKKSEKLKQYDTKILNYTN